MFIILFDLLWLIAKFLS